MGPKLPVVVIIGRANTGKSSLFNCLIEEKKAVTSELAGTTRDRNYSPVNWQGRHFLLVDTGGLDLVDLDRLEKDVIKQTNLALASADVVLFMVDGRADVLPQDREVAKILRRAGKPVILVVNKIDNEKVRQQLSPDFLKLGFNPLLVSAKNGVGTGDLLDEITKGFKITDQPKKMKLEEKPIRVAIIGKPNVGKSSLVNALLGENRVIVSNLPHTTRDPQDSYLTFEGHDFVLIDTAGIRRKGRIGSKAKTENVWPGGVIERESVKKSLYLLTKADIIFLVINLAQPLAIQDRRLAGLAVDSKKGLILVANQWDLVRGQNEKTFNQHLERLQTEFPFLAWVPVVLTSAKTGLNVKKLLELSLAIRKEQFKLIDQETLSEFIRKLIKKHQPSRGKGTKHPKIYDFAQIKTNPPVFIIKIGAKEEVHFSYLRFIENKLRESFGFNGVPIKLIVRHLS